MRIVGLDTSLIEVPLPRPVGTAIHAMRSVGCVLVELRTDDGLVGQSYVFTLNAARLHAFDQMIRGFASFVVGRDPHETEGVWHDIWAEINPTGHQGVTVSAMSAIDVACWDVVGKAAQRPLHQLFGACRTEVDTYASSGLWLSHTLDELAEEAAAFVAQGFTSVKLRIGSPRIADDVERVRVVRDVVGPDIGLLVDANQAFTPKHAIRLGRRLEEFDLVWIEEPVSTLDLAGHSQVRQALATPIASGETTYTRYGISAMAAAGAADVLMPDLQRIGGYSEFRKAAAVASAHHLAVSTHFFTELSLVLAGSIHSCVSVEHVDWFSPLFVESVELVGGKLQIPNRPGTGFTFAPDLVERFGLSS